MRLIYGKGCKERIDFTRFGSLELALGHTWGNLQANPAVTLLFYQPPEISYEIRGRAEIHREGSVYHRLITRSMMYIISLMLRIGLIVPHIYLSLRRSTTIPQRKKGLAIAFITGGPIRRALHGGILNDR